MTTRLFRSTLTLAAGSGGSAVLALLLSILIGRVTGEQGLGLYAAALAWVFPLSLIVEAGMNTLITRDLARADAPYAAHDLLRAVFRVRVIVGAVVMLALWLAAPLLTGDAAVAAALRLFSPLVLINPLYGAFTAVLRAYHMMTPAALMNVGMLLCQVILTAAAFALGGGVRAALTINLITSAGVLGVAYAVWRGRFASLTGAAPHALPIGSLMRRALPFAVAAVLAALQLRAATIFLERLTDTAQVGYYTAAARFLEGGRVLSLAFFDALLPSLSALALNRPLMQQTFRRAALTVTVLGVGFGVGAVLFAPLLIRLTYGERFAPAAEVLAVLAWSLLPTTLKYARGLYWYAQGREARVIAVTALTLVLQVIVSLWAIPLYGAAGAAWVVLGIESLSVLLLWR